MNFVGHIYLSGENERIAIGNFIGDYVKGKGYERYPEDIRKGILIHRDIDATVDAHPAFLNTKALFKETYGRYAGVVVDMAFDHILTKNWDDWHSIPLKKFTRNFYGLLLKNFRALPSQVKEFLPFMIQSNRLYTYASLDGIEKALSIMANYTSLPNKQAEAAHIIQRNETEIAQHFYQLLGDLSLYINSKYEFPVNSKASAQIAKSRLGKEQEHHNW
jgi:acyl carrier protein phosphodiesterase